MELLDSPMSYQKEEALKDVLLVAYRYGGEITLEFMSQYELLERIRLGEWSECAKVNLEKFTGKYSLPENTMIVMRGAHPVKLVLDWRLV